MNGPDHYREAERLGQAAEHLEQVAARSTRESTFLAAQQILIGRAQVHATLALAAATVASRYTESYRSAEGRDAQSHEASDEWRRVTGD